MDSIFATLQANGIDVTGIDVLVFSLAGLAFFARRIISRAIINYIIYALVFLVMGRVLKPLLLSAVFTM